MTEASIEHCLELCSAALAQGGEALSRSLRELQEELCRLRRATESVPRTDATPGAGESVDEPVITMDLDGYLTDWNSGAQKLFGYTPEEAIGRHILFLYDECDGNENNAAFEICELSAAHGSPLLEVRRRKKSGDLFRAKLALTHIFDRNDVPVGMQARLWEIADRLSSEERQGLHAHIIEHSDQGIVIVDTDERIVSVNSAFTRITGYSAAEAIGSSPDLLRSGVHSADFRIEVRGALRGSGAWHGEIIGKRKNGDIFPQSVAIGVVRDDNEVITHAFSVFSDISVLRATEARMQRVVNYDNLTGLPNRALFSQLVDQALFSARRSNGHAALLVIDVKRCTRINETLGHEVGEALLQQVAQRLREALREADILARAGGDEFVVALLDVRKREHSGLVAEKLIALLQAPFVIESHVLHIGAGIGIAIYPEDGADTATLMRLADVATKRVQANSESGYLFYNPEMNRRAKEQWQLESELRAALKQAQLRLHYQPKVSLRSGRIVGAEALVRWPHPTEGMISPAKFVPLAEETGLILELGNWILDAACQQIRRWLDRGIDLVPIAVNLSARQFTAELPERLMSLTRHHGVPCELLKLEITESLLVRGHEKVVPIMNSLVACGFTLALDDFGTGYSSLAYLKRFPISTLKIDRAFVVGVPDDENDCAIAQAIVTMGKQLRQEIVAEGVETVQQMAFLRQLGCDQLQGFLFSAPVDAVSFEQMLNARRRLALV